MTKNILIGFIAVTIVLLVGGVFLISRSLTRPEEAAQVTEASQKKGAETGNVTLVEFGDFECPSCKAYEPVINQLVDEFGDNLKFVWRNFPLPQHRSARFAAIAAEAAGKQGKFWEMHRKLFETQTDWAKAGSPTDLFIQYAAELGMDKDAFAADMKNEEVAKKVQADVNDGNGLGVNSTPTFFLNGQKIANPGSLEDFQAVIKGAIIAAPIVQTEESKYHAHADIKVYVRGKAIDFSLDKYQSAEGNELNPDIHFHDSNGKVFHMHKANVPMSALFESLDMKFEDDWRMYINGVPSVQKANYVPQDLDRILITDEPESSGKITELVKSVTDEACIYSEKCPERGTPPTENCVGGLGTGCEPEG